MERLLEYLPDLSRFIDLSAGKIRFYSHYGLIFRSGSSVLNAESVESELNKIFCSSRGIMIPENLKITISPFRLPADHNQQVIIVAASNQEDLERKLSREAALCSRIGMLNIFRPDGSFFVHELRPGKQDLKKPLNKYIRIVVEKSQVTFEVKKSNSPILLKNRPVNTSFRLFSGDRIQVANYSIEVTGDNPEFFTAEKDFKIFMHNACLFDFPERDKSLLLSSEGITRSDFVLPEGMKLKFYRDNGLIHLQNLGEYKLRIRSSEGFTEILMPGDQSCYATGQLREVTCGNYKFKR